MHNINNSQTSGNVFTQAITTNNNSASQQPGNFFGQQLNLTNQLLGSTNVSQLATSLIQQLLQLTKDNKESKAREHHENSLDQASGMEEDLPSEIMESFEAPVEEGTEDEEHEGGGQKSAEGELIAEEFNQPSVDAEAPLSVSGGGVTVGTSPYSNDSRPIPNNRVIVIEGQNYSVGFLKKQVSNYSNSSFANSGQDPDGASVAQVAVNTPWGGASLNGYGTQFEAYIRETFPGGDPSVSANPSAKYEGAALIVNGQTYGASLNNSSNTTSLSGELDSSLTITGPVDNQMATRDLIASFNEVGIISDSGDGDFEVSVPAGYFGQWQAALMDNLPGGSEIKATTGFFS